MERVTPRARRVRLATESDYRTNMVYLPYHRYWSVIVIPYVRRSCLSPSKPL